MLSVSSVFRVGLLYTLSTSSGAVFSCFTRSNDCTEETQRSKNIKTLEAGKHLCTSYIVSQCCLFLLTTLYIIICLTFIFTFLLGIHIKYVIVFLFAVCVQKMELSFQPLNFLKENDKHTKITRGNESPVPYAMVGTLYTSFSLWYLL